MRLQAAAFGGTGRRQPAHTLPQTGDGTRITLSSGGARSPGRQTAAVITMITTFGSGDRNGSRCRSEASVTTGREGLRGRTLDGTWRTRTRGDARVTPYRAAVTDQCRRQSTSRPGRVTRGAQAENVSAN